MDLMTESVIDSPRFKRWFKGSKVVDEDGNPLICYHGTTSWKGQFKQWRPFTHFGTSRAATDAIMRRYDDIIRKNPITPHRSRIYPVFLSIKNPIPMNDDGDLQHGPDQYQMELKTQLLIDIPSYKSDAIMRAGFNMLFFQHHKKKRITGEFPNRENIEEVIIRQKSRITKFGFQYNFSNKVRLTVIRKVMMYYGYDGFVYENVVEHPGSISWVIIDDSQVWPIFKEGMDNQFFLTPTDRDVNPKYPLPVDSVAYKDISEPEKGYNDTHGPKKAKWPDSEIEMDEDGSSKLYIKDDNIEVRNTEQGYDILYSISGETVIGKLSVRANNQKKGFVVDFKEKPGFKDRKVGKKLFDHADEFFKQLGVSMKATKPAIDLWQQQKG